MQKTTTGSGRKRILVAVGVGGACAGGASLAGALLPFPVAACEDAVAQTAAKGAIFMWGRRFTGNDIIGCVQTRPICLVVLAIVAIFRRLTLLLRLKIKLVWAVVSFVPFI